MGLMSFRGFGDTQSCPGGGAWDAGLQVCCAPPGTPPMQDPCSILNNPAFINQQNTQIQADIASIPASTFEGQELAVLTSVPTNIGQDAVYCQSNPGVTFVDSEGITIVCPSPSHSDLTTGGQPMSTYTTAQLAQMLNSQYGAKSPTTPGNLPFTAPPVAPTAQPTQQQMQSVTGGGSSPQIRTSGNPGGGSSSSGGSSNSSTSSTSTGIDLSFLTNSDLISGLPNWAVAFGAIAALMILPGLFGGRR